MKKKVLFAIAFALALVCFFALAVSADELYEGVYYSLNSSVSPPTASVTGVAVGTSVVNIPSTITVNGTEYRVTSVTSVNNKSASKTLVELYITSEYITGLSGFGSSTNLKKIYITSPVESYAASCFNNCYNVEDVYVDFSHTKSIGSSAFLFTAKAENVSKAVWNYNGEPINLYNVTFIDNSAFAASRIGGKFEGGTENTIIWPKKTTYMGQFCFSNCYIGGTVYINSTNVASNKQFSLNNSFETFIIGPDTTTIYNFNNGEDTGFKDSVDKVIILSKGLINGGSRTNLFHNWGEFDLYYYSDIQAVINKQTTIGGATHHLITSHTLSYDNGCCLSVTVYSDITVAKTVNNTHHVFCNGEGTVNKSMCPVGAVNTVPCDCGATFTNKLNSGYSEIKEHAFMEHVTYANGFDKAGVYTVACSECDYAEATELDPLIFALGYSFFSGNGERDAIANGYSVNTACVDLYNNVNGVNLEIGVLFTTPAAIGDELPTSLDKFQRISNDGENLFSVYEYIIRYPAKGTENYARYASLQFIVSAYIYDGESYFFFQDDSEDEIESVLPNGFTTTTIAKITGYSSVKIEETDEDSANVSANIWDILG